MPRHDGIDELFCRRSGETTTNTVHPLNRPTNGVKNFSQQQRAVTARKIAFQRIRTALAKVGH